MGVNVFLLIDIEKLTRDDCIKYKYYYPKYDIYILVRHPQYIHKLERIDFNDTCFKYYGKEGWLTVNDIEIAFDNEEEIKKYLLLK